MGSKTCTYMLRTIRQLQCNALAGMSAPKFPRKYRLVAKFPAFSGAHFLRSELSLAPVPIRCISNDTSLCNEEQNMTSDLEDETFNDSNVNHVSPLNEHISFESDELARRSSNTTTMMELNECTTPTDVLNVFSSPLYGKDELFKGVLQLWLTFLALDKQQKLIERDAIVGHPHFQNLTYGVRKMAPFLPAGALVYMLYVFVRLKVNQESKFIQDLLLLCQKNLNSLNEEELAIMANTLKWLKSDKNVDILKFGLRLLMDIKIQEVKEVTPLLTMMKAVGTTAPLHFKLKFESKTLQMVDRFNVEQSKTLFCILSDIGLHSEQLLDVCSGKLIDGIDEISYPEMIRVLSCCCKLNYSNERLLTVFGDQIMKNICLCKPHQLARILHYFTKLRFQHIPLLDAYADIFTNNLDSVKIWDLAEATKVYSVLNYLPEEKSQQFLDAVDTSLQTHLDSIVPKTLLDIVYSLCVLGVCPEFAIRKLLQYEDILNLKEHSFLLHNNLCLMMDKPFIHSYSLEKLHTTTSEDIQTFHTDMKSFIKNPDLYQNSMLIANTYYIDFILALDTQENKLVPVGDMQTDDQQITDSSENITRIAVLCCTSNAFALGTLHPLGKLALKIRDIESFGFTVVVVPVHKFVKMTEEIRMEYLKTIIFQELSGNENALEDRKAVEDLQKPSHEI